MSLLYTCHHLVAIFLSAVLYLPPPGNLPAPPLLAPPASSAGAAPGQARDFLLCKGRRVLRRFLLHGWLRSGCSGQPWAGGSLLRQGPFISAGKGDLHPAEET